MCGDNVVVDSVKECLGGINHEGNIQRLSVLGVDLRPSAWSTELASWTSRRKSDLQGETVLLLSSSVRFENVSDLSANPRRQLVLVLHTYYLIEQLVKLHYPANLGWLRTMLRMWIALIATCRMCNVLNVLQIVSG